MSVVAYVALGVLVIASAALVALRPWPFPPSLTLDELNGLARLNASDPGGGTGALSSFYGWRQDLWSVLTRGCAAFAVALLLALVGATLEAGKTVKVTTTGPTPEARSTSVTSTETKTSPEVLALIGGLIVLSTAAWLRSRAVQREFAADAGRLS
jgi:hypothetical protein